MTYRDKDYERAMHDVARDRDPQRELMLLVLYERPRDFPELYIVRCWSVGDSARPDGRPNKWSFGFKMRATAQAWIRQEFPHLAFFAPEPGDDPVIVGCWM